MSERTPRCLSERAEADNAGIGRSRPAAGVAVLYGAAYPATAVALRSFPPLGIAGWSSSLAMVLVAGLSFTGLVARPQLGGMTPPGLGRLIALSLLGGAGFIATVNAAVSLGGPTITRFVAPLYAVLATLFAVPILDEPVRILTVAAFAVALAGTVLLAGAARWERPSMA